MPVVEQLHRPLVVLELGVRCSSVNPKLTGRARLQVKEPIVDLERVHIRRQRITHVREANCYISAKTSSTVDPEGGAAASGAVVALQVAWTEEVALVDTRVAHVRKHGDLRSHRDLK